MPAPKRDDARAWVQARLDEYGSIERARPEGFSQTAWRELVAHYGLRSPRFKKINSLDEALRAVADLAKP